MSKNDQILRKLMLAQENPDLNIGFDTKDLAALVITVMKAVKTIEQSMNNGQLDIGAKLKKDIEKAIADGSTMQKQIAARMSDVVSDLESQAKETKTELTTEVKNALAEMRSKVDSLTNGEDGIVTDAEIQRAATIASELIDVPDFDELVNTAITSNGGAIRDALELLQGDARLSIDAISGTENWKKELAEMSKRGMVNGGGGFGPNTVLKMIQENAGGLPDQTGNNGKFLTTDGTDASWATLAGGGDMAAAVYDPTAVGGDAFAMDNMVEGADTKILTAAERTKLSNTSGTNTGDQDISGIATNAAAITAHLNDATDAHDASAISVDNTNFDVITATDQQSYNEQNDTALLNARTTGVREGGRSSVNGGVGVGSGMDITAGAGQILNNTDPANPTYTSITWTAQTNVTQTATGLTWWYFDDNSNAVKQQTSVPTPQERRTRIFVSRTNRTGSIITGIVSEMNPIQQEGHSIKDLAEVFGTLKAGGLLVGASGANLNLAITSGTVYDYGSNWNSDYLNPHKTTEATFDTGVSGVFRYATSTGVITTDRTAVRVGFYQVAGTETAIPGASSRYGIHYVFRFPGGNTRLVYGDNWYTSRTDAQEAVSETKALSLAPAGFSNAILLGAILAQSGETTLQSANTSFIQTNLFGSFSGGVVGATSGAYLEIANNLSDVENAATTLINLGLTATAAEVNILDGVTATTAELNFVDGVTSNVQTQLNAKAPTAAPTFTGDTTVADLQITGEFGADAEVDDGNSSTADTIDWTTGNFHKSTMTGNCTYTFTAPTYVGRYQLMLVQDATGSRTATWPASAKWPGGTAPTLSTAASSIDIITFYFDGTNFYGVDSLAFA